MFHQPSGCIETIPPRNALDQLRRCSIAQRPREHEAVSVELQPPAVHETSMGRGFPLGCPECGLRLAIFWHR